MPDQCIPVGEQADPVWCPTPSPKMHVSALCTLHCGKKLATDDTVFERGEDLGHILQCTNRSIMKLKREFVNHEFSLYGLISADYMLGTWYR